MKTENIYSALLEAQKKIETITKDATANAGSFKYTYATLGQVMEMVKKPLNDNGLIISQPIMGGKVITCLFYTDGTKIEDGGTPIICARQNDPQAQGSAISYSRRYGLMSLLCLSAEDDDGAKAMKTTAPVTPGQTKTSTPTNSTTSTTKYAEQKIVTFHLQDKNIGTAVCNDCGSHMFFSEGISKKTNKPWTMLRCEGDKTHVAWYPKVEQATNWSELSEPTIIVEDINDVGLPF